MSQKKRVLLNTWESLELKSLALKTSTTFPKMKSHVKLKYISEGSNQVVIGGGALKEGSCGSVIRKVVSQNLKWLNWDSPVNRYWGHVWADGTDYLFFRNTARDRNQTSCNLELNPTHAAYTCQCCWISVGSIQPVNLGETVREKLSNWVAWEILSFR